MGVVISKSTLNPLSFISVIVGFISFAFTLATFLRVVWTNIMTLSEAPHEVHTYLTNLRTELLEERGNLKVMRKSSRRRHRLMEKGERDRGSRGESGGELDETALKTMSDAVRHLCRRFKVVEQPFLEPGEEGIDGAANQHKRRRTSRSVSPYYTHSAYASPPEKGGEKSGGAKGRTDHEREKDRDRDRDYDDDEDMFWAQRTRYAKYGLRQRFQWLYKKADAQDLFQILSRLQTRRIARQVGSMSVQMHEYGSATMEMETMMRRMDERMSRFVGVRRVEDDR